MRTADPWQALGDTTRRRVLGRVADGASSVGEIARGLPVSRPAVSQHLRVLLDAGLVHVTPLGRTRRYRVRPEGLAELTRELESYWRGTLSTFKEVAERSYRDQKEAGDGER